MGLPILKRQELEEALVNVGIKEGDGLMVHSALQFLGRPEDGVGMYLDALLNVLGPKGTLAVPTFSFLFAHGMDLDPNTTPSEGSMGVFSEYVRRHPYSWRTIHPMALALIGAQAEELADIVTPSAFEDGSAFDGMLQMGFKLLFMGADVQAASMVHYCEQRAEVPYRYWKPFTGKVRVMGEWESRTFKMYVRDLDLDPKLNLEPIQLALQAKDQWTEKKLNFGAITACTMVDFVSVTEKLLQEDPWILVANRAEIEF